MLIAAYGDTVCSAVEEAGFHVNIAAPTETASSMNQAIEQFLTDYYKAGGDLEKMPAKYKYVPKPKETAASEKDAAASGRTKADGAEAVAERTSRGSSRTAAGGTEKRQKVSLHGKTIEVKVAANRAAALAVMEKKKKK